jgi:hypothetical protein
MSLYLLYFQGFLRGAMTGRTIFAPFFHNNMVRFVSNWRAALTSEALVT